MVWLIGMMYIFQKVNMFTMHHFLGIRKLSM